MANSHSNTHRISWLNGMMTTILVNSRVEVEVVLCESTCFIEDHDVDFACDVDSNRLDAKYLLFFESFDACHHAQRHCEREDRRHHHRCEV